MSTDFNIVIIGQSGRLQYEALLFALSLRATGHAGRLFVAEPQPGALWSGDPRIKDNELRALLEGLDVTFLPFDSRHFGAAYPYGNKIEALFALPEGEPFVFFDTDTMILDDPSRVPFDFDRPCASLNVEPTWPQIELYGPSMESIWKSVYDLVGLDFESAIDPSEPEGYWRRYPYYNAGYFHFRCPREFGLRFLDYALAIRDRTPDELVIQQLDPWLDQVALPLVIHSFGGSRSALEPGWIDGTTSLHYRALPLLYAKASDAVISRFEELISPNKIKKVLKNHEPFKKLVYQQKGRKVRELFDQNALPRKEQAIRNAIKAKKLWLR